MKVLKIKDSVPIDILIDLGFKECNIEIGKEYKNHQWVTKYETTRYSYEAKDENDTIEIHFKPKSRILFIGGYAQENVPLPNIIYYMIKEYMIELIELEDWKYVR